MSDKLVKNILVEARRLVGEGWCRGAFARKVDNVPVTAKSPDAIKFCAIGAIEAASKDVGYQYRKEAEWLLLKAYRKMYPNLDAYPGEVSWFNDYKAVSRYDIIDIYDRAIKLARWS